MACGNVVLVWQLSLFSIVERLIATRSSVPPTFFLFISKCRCRLMSRRRCHVSQACRCQHSDIKWRIVLDESVTCLPVYYLLFTWFTWFELHFIILHFIKPFWCRLWRQCCIDMCVVIGQHDDCKLCFARLVLCVFSIYISVICLCEVFSTYVALYHWICCYFWWVEIYH